MKVLLLLFASLGISPSLGFADNAFDVVSIRPGTGRPVTLNGMQVVGVIQGGPGSSNPGRLTANSVSLRDLVLTAYGVTRRQLAGPGWIETARYDVNARVPAGTTQDQFKLMLQAMLEDRFGLKVHHEAQVLPAYSLVVGKHGLKLSNAVSMDACSSGARPVQGTCDESAAYRSGIMRSSGTERAMLGIGPFRGGLIISGTATPFSALVTVIARALGGSIVVDKTGITDKFNFRFEFASPTLTGQDEASLPTLFKALDEAGLKLQSTKTTVDVLVVDHVERPGDN